jgi:hypothetical protein
LQALSSAFASGGGTAQAVAQATAEAYGRQPEPVVLTLTKAITQANSDPAQVSGLSGSYFCSLRLRNDAWQNTQRCMS